MGREARKDRKSVGCYISSGRGRMFLTETVSTGSSSLCSIGLLASSGGMGWNGGKISGVARRQEMRPAI